MALIPSWSQASHILAIRLDGMGDVLMTSPALAAIRQAPPVQRLTLLTSAAGAEAGRQMDVVDEVLVHAAPWVKSLTEADDWQADRALIDHLAAQRFDAAVIFTVCTQSALPAALACRLAGIPLRLAQCRENPYALLTDHLPERDASVATARHEVQRQLELVAHVGYATPDQSLRLCTGPHHTATMQQALIAAGGTLQRPFLVIHAGASAPSRRYPAERFGAAAQALQVHTDCQIVFTGSADERELVRRAAAMMDRPPLDLTGQLSLGELAALIAQAQLLVCNNTGPAHIAAAMGTPVVVVYALTNLQHTPWRVPARVLSHDVPCRNCLKSQCPQGDLACLLGIRPDQVVKAALDLRAETASRPPAQRAAPLSLTTTRSTFPKPQTANAHRGVS